MPDTFAVTVIFIVLAGFVAAFVRKRSRDKCLKDFSANMVTLEEAGGEEIGGQLVLPGHSYLCFVRIRVFKPAVGVVDFGTVINVHNRKLVRRWIEKSLLRGFRRGALATAV